MTMAHGSFHYGSCIHGGDACSTGECGREERRALEAQTTHSQVASKRAKRASRMPKVAGRHPMRATRCEVEGHGAVERWRWGS